MTDLGDIDKLIRALSATVQKESVNKKAALDAHTMATKRIFPARGVSKDSQNRPLGVYAQNTMSLRRKKNRFNRGVNLQFTGQLHESWGVIEQGGRWISGFLISGRTDSNQNNDEVADKLEDQYTTYGDIFEKTKEEEEFYIKRLEKYQDKLLNK